MFVRKKRFGQHFLHDLNIAGRVVDALPSGALKANLVEVGPGKGVLTRFLLQKGYQPFLIEIDDDLVAFLKKDFPQLNDHIKKADILRFDFSILGAGEIYVIGNFPYNISSQILLKVIENREQVIGVVGMFQKEVAHRITGTPGGKEYGILSVLTQTFYDTEFLFEVKENAFAPPPKVRSGVIRLVRNEVMLPVPYSNYFKIVKMAFQQRRKMLRNSLAAYNIATKMPAYATRRPEELSADQFIILAAALLPG